MSRKKVTEVIAALRDFGFDNAAIGLNISKGLSEDKPEAERYIDDRTSGAIDDTKFRAVLDALTNAVKPAEVDIAKSANAAAEAARRATTAKGGDPTLADVLARVELSIVKSEQAVAMGQRVEAILVAAIPQLAAMNELTVIGVKNIEKSQNNAFSTFTETLKTTRIQPVAAGAKATHASAPPKKAKVDDRPEDDEDSENALEIFKSEVSQRLSLEINDPSITGQRRHLLGMSAAILPRLEDVQSIKKVARDLGYNNITVPQA